MSTIYYCKCQFSVNENTTNHLALYSRALQIECYRQTLKRARSEDSGTAYAMLHALVDNMVCKTKWKVGEGESFEVYISNKPIKQWFIESV